MGREKFHVAEVFLGVLLACAIFALGFVVSFSYRKIAEQPTATEAQYADTRQLHGSGFWDWLHSDAAGYFAAWLVLIGGLQLVLFVRQLRLIRHSLGPAKDAAESARLNAQAVIESERARLYLVMEDDAIGKAIRRASAFDHPTSRDMHISGLPHIEYSFKNYGRTPALIEAIKYRVAVEEAHPVNPQFREIVPLPFDYVLGPGDVTTPPTKAIPPTMLTGTAVDIRRNKTTFWFSGCVTYKDTFSRRYSLYWLWKYNGASDGFRLVYYREIEEQTE